jgi:hypothetical protein
VRRKRSTIVTTMMDHHDHRGAGWCDGASAAAPGRVGGREAHPVRVRSWSASAPCGLGRAGPGGAGRGGAGWCWGSNLRTGRDGGTEDDNPKPKHR